MDRNILVAFDFDHTICDGNTDLVVQNLLPIEISKDVHNLRKSSGWIVYMSKIFELLHENSVKSHQIANVIIGIPEVAGMQSPIASRYDKDKLRVDPYHIQDTCKMSTVNLCKGQILTDYIQDKHKQGKSYERIVYVGDGRNDLCPILRLSETDLACPRKGYSLINQLNELSTSMSTKAKIVPWEDGTDLQFRLEQFIELPPLT
ncbi:Pyridoxal phosphate phosphatase PHOSPHO2 [Acromyrmex echinatior]|uniref:Pyridoxal phosphate phosphatase PHOSPHO2 n=1 Tax=Acromyrmex echinatior TaxID=103372 RepID=F4WWD6_ACREC|nr:Pyridoxal phosphate phosphatase PHOSPHO2 [Acromyrmex echinatior]